MRARERRGPLHGLVAATSFLTRLPLGRRAEDVDEEDLRAGAAWFPAVGAAVGSIAAAVGWAVAARAPAPVAGVVAVAVGTIVTWALHLDGLADTADGIGAASTGRDALSVMRDPSVGAFGVVALVLDLGLRIAATSAVLSDRGFPWAIVGAAAAARFAPLPLARALPYLHHDGGAGRWMGRGPAIATLVFAGGTALVACAPAGVWAAAAIVAAVGVVTFGVGIVARRRFGGVTGDVLGAATELAETIALTTVVVVIGR